MAASEAFEPEQSENKAERVDAQMASPFAWTSGAWTAGDNNAWRQSQQSFDKVELPTLHLGPNNEEQLNRYDSYSVNSKQARIYMDNRAAVVRINTMDPKVDASFSTSAGSGSIIDSSGVIATGYHVVKNAAAIRVKTDDGKIYDAKILDADAAKDQALLQIKADSPFYSFPTVKLANESYSAANNRQLMALGFPRNQDAMHLSVLSADRRVPLSALKVTGGLLLGEDQHREIIRAKGFVFSGNSGGPAFDLQTGEQVGIVNMSNKNETYITPVEDLHRFIASSRFKQPQQKFPSFPSYQSNGTNGLDRLGRILSN